MYKIIRNSKFWFILSGLLTIIGIIALALFGLRVGIDYKGGTIMEIQSATDNRVTLTNQALADNGIENYQVKDGSSNKVLVRMPAITNEQHLALSNSLAEKLGSYSETQYDTVGPTIGKDLTNKSIIAVILASLGIIFYIAYAFRKLPRPLSSWKFGVSAVIALTHDLLITTGFVALLGHFFVWMEVDVLFITALLTIMGFSVHDTIVIYDRLRENFLRNPHRDFTITAEESVNQTLARSINTSMTVVLVLLALVLLGGDSIRHFVLTLVIGVIIGTYSSIFVAAPLVVAWHKSPSKAKTKAKASAA